VIFVLSALALVSMVAGFAMASRGESTVRPGLGDDEVTAVARPTLNPENQPLVAVLYGIAAEFSRTPDALRDVARVLQLAEKRAGEAITERLARIVEDVAPVAHRGAADIRKTAVT
jgi:hypothetical protein